MQTGRRVRHGDQVGNEPAAGTRAVTTPIVYLNGEYLPHDGARVSVDDRGFLFADGIYEVTRVVHGTPFESERHFQRMAHGLSALRIDARDDATPAALSGIMRRLLDENGLSGGDATVYCQITRGAAPRTHEFPKTRVRPTVYVRAGAFTPPDALRAKGATVITCPDTRWSRCDIKTVGLLPNVLAKQAATDAGVTEAVFVRDGVITEGSHTNVCAVIAGTVHTHPADHHILRGITRDVVLELARPFGVEICERPVPLTALMGADEVFLVGTTMDVMPVVRVDGRPIGDGRPRPLTRRLSDALAARMQAGAAAPQVA
jgi:D-alanine transaminase